jgi:hypothetical protein
VKSAGQAIDVLVECDWLRPDLPKDEKRQGYGVRFLSNPRVREG